MSALYADGDCVGGLALHLGLLGLPYVLLVAVQGRLLAGALAMKLHVRVPLGTHHVALGGGQGHARTPHPTLVPRLLGPANK